MAMLRQEFVRKCVTIPCWAWIVCLTLLGSCSQVPRIKECAAKGLLRLIIIRN
jgi:hypothetical protein